MMTCLKPFAMIVVLVALMSTASAQSGIGNTGTTGGNTGSTGNTGQNATTSGGTTATGTIGSGLSGTSTFGGTVPGESTSASNAATTFIGSNATQGFVGGATQGNAQQGSNRQFQAIQNQTQQVTTQQSGTPREVRSTLRIGFAFPTATQSQMVGRLADANVASLTRFIPSRPELAGISVDLDSVGVAVLHGSADSVETRRLAANLMRLQPGVRRVDNQIVVPVN